MDTIKIKPTDPESQGDYVIINREDFDPELHDPLEPVENKRIKIADLRAELTAKGIEFSDGASKAELQSLLDASR